MDDAQARLLDTILDTLAVGAADPASPFHVLTLGTLSDGVPRLRSVVLRGVDRAAHRLTVHTDARSPKVAEIEAESRVELHVWDDAGKVQLRLAGLARLHGRDARAAAEWSALSEHTRATYQVGAPPSSVLHGPPPPDQDLAAASAVFTVIDVTLSSIEHLLLSRDGNRRALFHLPQGVTGGVVEANWLVA